MLRLTHHPHRATEKVTLNKVLNPIQVFRVVFKHVPGKNDGARTEGACDDHAAPGEKEHLHRENNRALMQSLSIICDEILATEDQDEVIDPAESASPTLAPSAGAEESKGKQSVEDERGRAENEDSAQKLPGASSQRSGQDASFRQGRDRSATTSPPH